MDGYQRDLALFLLLRSQCCPRVPCAGIQWIGNLAWQAVHTLQILSARIHKFYGLRHKCGEVWKQDVWLLAVPQFGALCLGLFTGMRLSQRPVHTRDVVVRAHSTISMSFTTRYESADC